MARVLPEALRAAQSIHWAARRRIACGRATVDKATKGSSSGISCSSGGCGSRKCICRSFCVGISWDRYSNSSCCFGGRSSSSSSDSRRSPSIKGGSGSHNSCGSSRSSDSRSRPHCCTAALCIRRAVWGSIDKSFSPHFVCLSRLKHPTVSGSSGFWLSHDSFGGGIASTLSLHTPLRRMHAAAAGVAAATSAAGADQHRHGGRKEKESPDHQQQPPEATETAAINTASSATAADASFAAPAAAPNSSSSSSRNPCIILKPPDATPGGAERRRLVRSGHPWVFDFEIENIKHFNKMQTGKLLPVYDCDGTYLGLGLFSRQASVAVRMVTRRSSNSCSSRNTCSSSNSSNSSRSNNAFDVPNEEAVGELLCDRFRAAVHRRRLRYARQSLPADSISASSNRNNCSSSSSSSSNTTGLPNVWRAVDGEADGLPGVEVDVYGSAAVLRLSSQSVLPHRDIFVALVEETISPATLSVQTLKSKKEKLAQLLPLLRRHCAGATVLSVNGSSKGIGIGCCYSNSNNSSSSSSNCSSLPFEHSSNDGRGEADGTTQTTQTVLSAAEQEGAASLVMLESSHTVHTLNEKATAANKLSSAVSCVHTEDVLKELTTMKASALRFRGVYIHLSPNVRFSAAERGGQFGRWFRPSLRGLESQWSAAAALVERGGLLATSLLLPVHLSSWALRSLCRAAETAGKKPSLVFTSVASPDSRMMTVQTDLWKEEVFCLLLR